MTSPTDMANKEYRALLSDIKGRAYSRPIGSEALDFKQKAVTGELQVEVSSTTGTQLDVNIAKVLSEVLAHSNPVISRLTDGSAFYDVAKTGQLPSALDAGALKIKEQVPLTSISVSNHPSDFPDSDVLAAVALPTAVVAGEKTVADKDSPEALGSTTALKRGVVVQAKSGNTDSVFIGNVSAQKLELTAAESVPITIDDLAAIFCDVAVNGEGVNYLGG